MSNLPGDLTRLMEDPEGSRIILTAFLDNFPGPAFIRDSGSRYIYVNSCFEECFGRKGEWVGRTPSQLYSKEYAEEFIELDRKVLSEGYSVYERDLNLRTGPGDRERQIYEVHSFRIQDGGSGPLIGGVAVDITQWKESREALLTSEEKYRTVFENTGSATVIVEEDTTIVLANTEFERLSGYSAEEICGKMKWPEFLAPDHLERMLNHYRERSLKERSQPFQYELDFVDRGGCRKAVHLQVQLLPGTTMSVCSLLDISELTRTRDSLQRSLNHMESLLTAIPDMMFLLSRQGEYIDFRVDDTSVLAIPEESIVGSNIDSIGLEEKVLDHIMYTIGRVLDSGTVQTVEYQLDIQGTTSYYEGRLAPYENDTVLVLVRDITERRTAEMERLKLEVQVQQAQKLESLGILAGGIAHDFNNTLMAILGNADLALKDLPQGTNGDSLEAIKRAAGTASELAGQMLAYSGRSELTIEPLDLNSEIRELAGMLKIGISKKVTLDYRLKPGLPVIMADPVQVRQIIMNLITNASEAIGDRRGRISILTDSTHFTGEYFRGNGVMWAAEEGEYAFLEVSDTGCGMDPETLRQLFDPFFTTKTTGRGLGMSSVLGIVRSHGGAIEVESREGAGTRFRILFPVAGEERADSDASPPRSAQWKYGGGDGPVLLADDEDDVRDVGRRMLEYLGFQVLCAEDGEKAVELFSRHRDEIVLAVLDMTMPGLSGAEVFREIRKVSHDLPVIMASGFSRSDVMGGFTGEKPGGFLQKPYSIDQFSELLRTVLESSE